MKIHNHNDLCINFNNQQKNPDQSEQSTEKPKGTEKDTKKPIQDDPSNQNTG